MESQGAGKLLTSDANETRPSLRPVGTLHVIPLVCAHSELYNTVRYQNDIYI